LIDINHSIASQHPESDKLEASISNHSHTKSAERPENTLLKDNIRNSRSRGMLSPRKGKTEGDAEQGKRGGH